MLSGRNLGYALAQTRPSRLRGDVIQCYVLAMTMVITTGEFTVKTLALI